MGDRRSPFPECRHCKRAFRSKTFGDTYCRVWPPNEHNGNTLAVNVLMGDAWPCEPRYSTITRLLQAAREAVGDDR